MESAEDVLACPHCERQFLVTPAVLGKKIRCRGCRLPFRIPAGTPAARPAQRFVPRLPKATRAVVDGMDVRRCPVCGRAFAMQQSLGGKTIRCRACRNMFLVEAVEATDVVPPSSGRGEPSVPTTGSVEPPHSFAMPRAPSPPRSTAPVTEPAADEPEDPRAAEDIGDVLEDADSNEQCPVATVSRSYRRSAGTDAGGALAGLASVVLGGLTALPATLLILWWVFGKDPLHIAPMLPEAVRWLAPDHLAK
jgi:DNA-directed RNA polymerase subunit RPC12/RpoP